MTFLVGLTGGIGSGKSAAANAFRELGTQVIDADRVAREVVEPGSKALDNIAERYGKNILLQNDSLDRSALRKIVFESPKEREWLESLTHPLIRQSITAQLASPTKLGESNYRILESPLLLETNQHEMVRRICLVDASLENQIKRVIDRDNSDEAQVRAIIASQMSREEKLTRVNDVIDNNGDFESLMLQVNQLHKQYQTIATDLMEQSP